MDLLIDRRFAVRSLLLALGVLTAGAMGSQDVAAGDVPYPAMAPVAQYLIANRAEEIGLARSAAPPSIADHAVVLVLGARRRPFTNSWK